MDRQVPADELTVALGDPNRSAGPLTFGQAVADDDQERFPQESLDRLDVWGYRAFQVPSQLGGGLTSLTDLLTLGRVVARRDPTVAVIANSPLAASMPVWLAGTPEQRQSLAGGILRGERVALGLTEPDTGADLLASRVTAERTAEGYRVNGTKWLINNVRAARYLCLLAREPGRDGLRSLSLLLVDRQRLDPAHFRLLPRVPTHGVRGADIAGIELCDAPVPASALVGGAGRGLEITARALVVTRALVPGLSLGVLDTALACTLDFLRHRILYDAVATEIPFVREELAAAYLDLQVAEVVATACVRVLERLPSLAPVASAVAKYLVPHLVEQRVRALATVLGARYFLRQDHWFGIFEKLVRDSRLFGLFDGSAPVVLSTLAAQAPVLSDPDCDPQAAEPVFQVGGPAAPFPSGLAALEPVAETDPVVAGYPEVCAQLRRHGGHDPSLAEAGDLLHRAADELVRAAGEPVDPRSQAGQRLGERYARVFAATCLARWWLARSAPALPDPDGWLVAGLKGLLRPGIRMPPVLAAELYRRLDQRASGPDRWATGFGWRG